MVVDERGKVLNMKWQAALVGALASAALSAMFFAPAAFAEVHIVNDPGGEVSEYVQKFHELRDAGQHLVIDGPCLSACTLFTGIIPHDHVCVTRRAVLGFHAASYFDDAKRSLVPTRRGTDLIMRLYPPEIRDWIERHGGLSPRIIALRGKELTALYNTCPEDQFGN
jgi:hypothetical protein